MELQPLIYLFVGASFILYFGLAFWTKASSTKDFYIVKNSLNPKIVGISIAVDFLSATTFISLGGAFLILKENAYIYIVGILSGLLILALLIVPHIKKIGKFSIPEFFEIRYSINVKILAIFIILLTLFIYISAQLKGIGIIFSRVFQTNLEYGVIIGAFIVLFYTFIEENRDVTFTHIIRYFIILFSFLAPIFYMLFEYSSAFLPQLATFANISFDLSQNILQGENLNKAFLDSLNYFGFSQNNNSGLFNNLLLTISLMLGVAISPHILIKFFSTTSVKKAKKSILWAIIFVSIIYSSLYTLFMLSSINIVKNTNNIQYESSMHTKWLDIWQNIGLVKFYDSNNNGIIELKNSQNEHELIINPDAVTLLNPELANLPNWISALLLAGALAATLSTTTGVILILRTTFLHELISQNTQSHKIIKFVKNNNISRILIIITIIFASLFSIPNYTILQTVALALTLYTATLFPTMLLGIFNKNIPSSSAFFGFLIGFIFSFTYILYYIYINPQAKYILGISPEAIGVVGAILNFTIAIIFSKCHSLALKTR